MTCFLRLGAYFLILFILILQGCSGHAVNREQQKIQNAGAKNKKEKPLETNSIHIHHGNVDPVSHKIPVLCFHHINKLIKGTELYTVSATEFAQDLKMLHDSGYHAILPDRLYEYYTNGRPLPSKPFIITFDDTRLEHFTIAAPEMEKYNYKGVFFIMTISIGKPGYMTSEQIKKLSDSGHVIGCHTWDHHNVKEFHGEDWNIQIDQPMAKLEQITGKPIVYLSYPFGGWNDSAVYEVKKRGFKAAFQLNGMHRGEEPLYTIRRMIVPGGWSAKKLQMYMKAEF